MFVFSFLTLSGATTECNGQIITESLSLKEVLKLMSTLAARYLDSYYLKVLLKPSNLIWNSLIIFLMLSRT